MPAQNTKNMIGVLQAVAEYGRAHHWPAPRTFKVARMAVACVMTESNGHMYANTGVAVSMRIPHDAMGRDHDSVGLFQQRCGWDGTGGHGWGTAAQCMNIRHSTRAFLARADQLGLTVLNLPGDVYAYNGHHVVDIYDRIQCVQVSWYDGSGGRPFGGNYRANRTRSWLFMRRWWNSRTATARSKVSYL